MVNVIFKNISQSIKFEFDDRSSPFELTPYPIIQLSELF